MEKKTSFLYKIIYRIVKLVYPKIKVVGVENMPETPCIYVGNHSQLHGPLSSELYFPGNKQIWCASQMMRLKEVPSYAYKDFWSEKPRWQRPFWKIAAVIISPLSVIIFNNAHTIPVYHDTKVVSTFKKTVSCLEAGENIVIFPEKPEEYNHILYQFQDRYIDVAKLYTKRTGKEIQFVPVYLAPMRREFHIGKPIKFDSLAKIDSERERITDYLMNQITQIAEALPAHKVVPYKNLPKKEWKENKR